jgi:predicted kinase
MTDFTYRELGRLAGEGIGGVIVDATFHGRRLREAFLEQLGDAVERIVFVECRAPTAVLERRVRARAQRADRISDATLEVLRNQLASGEPFDDVPAHRHVIVRSDQPVERLVLEVEEALDRGAWRGTG